MRTLAVYLHEERVGQLEDSDGGQLRFTYSSEWLSREKATPLSRMLPLTSDTFKARRARPFFAGILPEEGPRRRIAEVLGISERNDFAMLERIGGECAGAVSLLPPDVESREIERRVRTLDEEELEAIVKTLPHRPLLAGEEGVRLSLAGAQEKLPVAVDGGVVSLPLGNTPSTHILKPEPDRFAGLAANEFFCMRLAEAAGLPVAGVTHLIVGGKPCILVARYDRDQRADGKIVRLHQEDFCQALGYPPERKYQQEGGPHVRECVALLREWSSTPVLDIRDFVDALIFNLLIGNADAHSKNYSMIYRGTERRLAPFYDIVSTIVWPELSKRLAMNIGKGEDVNDLNPDHFRRLAEEASLGWPMVRERIESRSNRVLETLQAGELVAASPDRGMATRVSELATQRCQRMLSYLNSTRRSV